MQSNRNIHPSVALAYTYLAAPYFIFFIGWLHWFIAIPLVILLATALLLVSREVDRDRGESAPAVSSAGFTTGDLLKVSLASLVFLILSGVGGYAFQDIDWFKHNAVLRELIDGPWPASVDTPRGEFPLVYYVAYYLPAALVGKVFGWNWAHHFLFLWSLIGLVLALTCLCALISRFSVIVVLAFFAFSGLDVLGLIVSGKSFGWHIEWWAWHWSYASNVTLLFWVPQMALPTWILSGLLIHKILFSDDRRSVILLFGLSPLWCPFISLGLAPYLAVDLIVRRKSVLRSVRKYFTIQNICGVSLLVVTGFYFAAGFCALPFKEAHGINLIFFAPRLQEDAIYVLARLVAFWIVEFGIWAAVVMLTIPKYDRMQRLVFITSVLTLVCLPFFRYGYFNDLVIRVSMPALFVLCVFVLRTIFDSARPRFHRVALMVLLVVAAVTPATETARHITRFSQGPAITKKGDLWSVHEEIHPYFPFITQYIGCRDTFFFGHLSRQSR